MTTKNVATDCPWGNPAFARAWMRLRRAELATLRPWCRLASLDLDRAITGFESVASASGGAA